MIVVSFGPAAPDMPFVPAYAGLRDGTFVSPAGPAGGGPAMALRTALELPEGVWFAVLEDESVETFPASSEAEWSFRKAQQLVERVGTLQSDPLQKLSLLRAAAELVKVPLPELLAGLSAARTSPEETLQQVMERLRKARSR